MRLRSCGLGVQALDDRQHVLLIQAGPDGELFQLDPVLHAEIVHNFNGSRQVNQ